MDARRSAPRRSRGREGGGAGVETPLSQTRWTGARERGEPSLGAGFAEVMAFRRARHRRTSSSKRIAARVPEEPTRNPDPRHRDEERVGAVRDRACRRRGRPNVGKSSLVNAPSVKSGSFEIPDDRDSTDVASREAVTFRPVAPLRHPQRPDRARSRGFPGRQARGSRNATWPAGAGRPEGQRRGRVRGGRARGRGELIVANK
jgi:hypothetical protein